MDREFTAERETQNSGDPLTIRLPMRADSKALTTFFRDQGIYAREIQESLLPKVIPQLPGFEVASSWQPARAVGGDYFDVLKLREMAPAN